MRKFFTNLKAMVGMLLMVGMLASVAVSCSYDDSELRQELEQIKQELADLRADLEGEINALKSLLDGKVTVSSVEKRADGSTVVTLSDNTSFVIYPEYEAEKLPTDLITVIYEGNVMYWAMYNAKGVAEPILVDGNKVPVVGTSPMFRENSKNGTIEVSFDGGSTWTATGYTPSTVDSIIKGVEIIYSDWQTDSEGNPVALYCEFTLSDGSTFRVGMQGARLVMSSDTVFVPYGTEREFGIQASGAADYMLEQPEGWECDITYSKEDQYYYINFTSPSYEDVMSGAAEHTGVFKMMVVFDDGMSAIARVQLTTEPANIKFMPDGVKIEAGYGCDYMMFGFLPKSIYKVETVMNLTSLVLGGQTHERVKEVGFFNSATAFFTYAEAYSSPFVVGTEYVFWYVVPRYEDGTGEQYVVETDIVTRDYVHSSVTFEVVESLFFDANVKFEAAGTNGYVVGFSTADEFNAETIAAMYSGNETFFDYYSKGNDSYTGSFVEYFDPLKSTLYPGVEYTLWCLSRSESLVFEADEVRSWSFTTRDFEAGGSLEIEEAASEIGYTTIEMELNTVGHIAIYSHIVPSYEASAYPTDELVIDMLRREGAMHIGSDAAVAKYDGKSAGEKVVVFAVAVDADGKYGKVFKKNVTTKAINYNDIDVNLKLVANKANGTRIEVIGEGAEEFMYIICQTSDTLWDERYGGSSTKAGYYIATNPDASDVRHTSDAKYALQDGCIYMDDLMPDTEYVIVVLAAGNDGTFSRPEALYFTPLPNIGEVVYANDPNWAVGKPTVTIGMTSTLEFYSFAWYVSPVEGYKAYTIAEFPANFTDPIYGLGIDTPEKLISYIMTNGQECIYSDNYSRTWWEYVWDEEQNTYIEEWFSEDGLPGVYNFYFYGTEGYTKIYTTWCDPDGNFHEAFEIDPAEK